MTDSLMIGANRLVKANKNMRLIADDIATDPGIRALVESVIEVEDYLRQHGDFEPNDKRANLLRAALRTWETGQ